MPIVLYDKASGRRLFEITEEQLASLVDALEEEADDDNDYYVDAAVCDYLEGKVDEGLLTQLRGLLGAPASQPAGGEEVAGNDEEMPEMPQVAEGVEILWKKE